MFPNQWNHKKKKKKNLIKKCKTFKIISNAVESLIFKKLLQILRTVIKFIKSKNIIWFLFKTKSKFTKSFDTNSNLRNASKWY